MPEVDTAARFATACVFALMAAVLFRDHRQSQVGLMAGLLAVAGCADQVTAPFGPRVGLLGAAFQAASISGIVWFWLLAKALFDDRFEWRHSYWLVLAALLTFSLGAYFYTDAFRLISPGGVLAFDSYKLALLPQQILILSLAALVFYEAIKDWRNDLVESRRRFRRRFITIATVVLLAVSFSNYLQLGSSRNPTVDAVVSLLGLAIVIAVAAMLLQIRSREAEVAPRIPFPSTDPSEVEAPLVAAIRSQMSEQHLFTEHGLTISTLAARLNEKEYRVRRAINASLGYRNFNQFLNQYRIDEASRRLLAPETRGLPVLTIAIDVGYSSLAPFNKAFKERHGMTPTEYRKRSTS